MIGLLNLLAVLALVGMAIAIPIGIADTVREARAWRPPHVDIPPGYRILHRPYDYERDQ